MHHEILKEEIIKHLEDLNKIESLADAKKMIETIATRYDAPKVVVEKAIAEWASGRG